MKYWLIKSEPDEFSFDDLARAKGKRTCWDGVRNYQARNFMRDEMKKGDLVLFYHSNAKPTGVWGTCEVVKEAYPDPTQFDEKDKHYDPKSDPANPRWMMVDVKYKQAFVEPVTLQDMREKKGLEDMALLRKGQRLSIQPVTKKEFGIVCRMGGL